MTVTSSVHNPTARLASEHPGAVKLARVGWFAKGVVYLLAGALALVVAARSFGWTDATSNSTEASPTGAIKQVAQSSGGVALLWVLAIGLFLYTAWRVITAFLPARNGAKSWVNRIGYLVSAVIYASFGATAINLARKPSANADGNQKVTDLTIRLMSHSSGRWLVGIVGAVALGAAAYRLVKGARVDVDDELDLSGMSPARARATRFLGAVGEIGRGVALALIGFFLLRAAVTYDAAEATGLDGALRRVANDWWGALLVAAVGLGFVAYGLFSVTTFWRRRLQAP